MKKYSQFSRILLAKLLVLFCLISISCEDVVDVDLKYGGEKLVIDAEIKWEKGTDGSNQTIKISRMADFYNPTPPKVSNALVRVENSQGTVFNFGESAIAGSYVCDDFIPVLGETYTLYVQVDDEVYTATEKMIPVPEINRVEQRTFGGFTGEDIEVFIFYNDPANETNYYLTEFISHLRPYPEYDVTGDQFFNGNENREGFSDEDIQPGDSLEITLRGISKQFHDYMTLILEANSGNPFATPPANIRGNILSNSSATPPPFGYFRLCESDRRVYVIE